MNFFYCFNILLLCLLSSVNMQGQERNKVEMPVVLSIPDIALVNLAGADKITFSTGRGVGQVITPSTPKTWINYSSIVNGNSTNNIYVSLLSGNLPVEVAINLEVGPDVGAGAGKTGRPSRKITLSPYAQEIISGIGSCYTGRGVEKGHQLTYSWRWLAPFNTDHVTNNIEVSVFYTLTSAE